jgi:hypothetical protein
MGRDRAQGQRHAHGAKDVIGQVILLNFVSQIAITLARAVPGSVRKTGNKQPQP